MDSRRVSALFMEKKKTLFSSQIKMFSTFVLRQDTHPSGSHWAFSKRFLSVWQFGKEKENQKTRGKIIHLLSFQIVFENHLRRLSYSTCLPLCKHQMYMEHYQEKALLASEARGIHGQSLPLQQISLRAEQSKVKQFQKTFSYVL